MLASITKRSDFSMQEKKTARQILSMTQLEKEKLIEKASQAHVNVSEYIRALINGRRLVVCDELPELMRQVVKIGVNVNQVENVALLSGSMTPEELEPLNKQLQEIQRLTRQVIRCCMDSKEK